MYIRNQAELKKLPEYLAFVPVGFGQFEGHFLWQIPDWYIQSICKDDKKAYCRLLDLQELSSRYYQQVVNKFRAGIERRKKAVLNFENLNDRQIEVLKLFHNRQYGGRIGRIGSGKTRTVLSLIKNFGGKSLIVCGKNIFSSWESEIKKYIPELNYVVVNGKKEQIYENYFDTYILNYHSFLNNDIVKQIVDLNFSNIFLDESQTIKNQKSKIAQMILKVSWHIPFRYFITGTPRTNHLFDYWTQIGFMDHGKRLGPNFYNYRNKYFYAKNFQWLIRESNKIEIAEKINQVCITDKIEKRKPEDEPDRRVVECELSDTEIKKYMLALKELKIMHQGEEKNIVSQLALITRLHQICGGGIGEERNETQSKMSSMFEYIEQIDEPVIIVCRYVHEILEIKKKYKNALLYFGGVNDRERENSKQNFINGKSDIFVIQQDAAVGIDGLQQNCRIMLFYSYWYKWDLLEQNQGRIDRTGQENKCVFVEFIAKLPGLVSQDEKIKKAVYDKDIDIKDFINMCAEE